jgi:hypothetical protein
MTDHEGIKSLVSETGTAIGVKLYQQGWPGSQYDRRPKLRAATHFQALSIPIVKLLAQALNGNCNRSKSATRGFLGN